ncbi:hypothetical protein EDB80DRAFT_869836 [Ilyonectria destructans]|nr:hypothetical protein EDB80DRAFT_869836 [Ilyonectria destructans]
MTGALATPRYSADDFETASIRSTAPSYVSEAPSYHSVAPYPEAVPPYSPPGNRSDGAGPTSMLLHSRTTQQTIGLPPVPSAPLRSVPNLNNFRIATWSNVNSRQYQRVAQRRASASVQRSPVDSLRRVMTERIVEEPVQERSSEPTTRPLEDPYLVGEVAASRARQERLARETGEDILVREDRQWDWWLLRMKDLDERNQSMARTRNDAEMSSRKKLLRRIGGRRLMM